MYSWRWNIKATVFLRLWSHRITRKSYERHISLNQVVSLLLTCEINSTAKANRTLNTFMITQTYSNEPWVRPFPTLLYQTGIFIKRKFWLEAYMCAPNFSPSLIKRKPSEMLSFFRHWVLNIAIAHRPVTKWKSPRLNLREHLKIRCAASRDQRTRQQAPAASPPASHRRNSIRV